MIAYTKSFVEASVFFFILYVHDILVASNDTNLLHDTKEFLTKKFKVKDLGDISFVLGICYASAQIYCRIDFVVTSVDPTRR